MPTEGFVEYKRREFQMIMNLKEKEIGGNQK